MLDELNRRLDAINGYVDGVQERSEANMPDLAPPFPNRLLRRQQVAKMIEENLFSPNLDQLHESVPHNYVGPRFIKQLLEHESEDERIQEERNRKKQLVIDYKEFISLMTIRKSKNAPQNV